MNICLVLAAIVLFLNIVVVSPLTAHHSIIAGFDLTKPTHIEGTVLEVTWANPHMLFTLRGKDATGASVEWRVEASSLKILRILGWTKETLMPGMNVRVAEYSAKKPNDSIFASTTVTFLSTQRVLKTPIWCAIDNNATTLADVENMISKCPIPEVP
jgi:Family of unknown function (DUF6152)